MRILILLISLLIGPLSFAQVLPGQYIQDGKLEIAKLLSQTDILSQKSTFKNDKPILFVFSATWCGPCNSAFPKLAEVQRVAGEELQIIFLYVWGSKKAWLDEKVHDEKNKSLIIAFDKNQDSTDIFKYASVKKQVPTSILVNANRKVISIDKHPLDISAEDLRQADVSNGTIAAITKYLADRNKK